MTAPSPDNGYLVSSTDEMTPDLFNAIFGSIHDRLSARELLEADFEALIASGTSAALTMVQENIAPQLVLLLADIEAAQQEVADIIGSGIAPDSSKLGAQLPAYYLDPANFTVSADVKSFLQAEDAAGARAALDIAGVVTAAIEALIASAPGTLDTLEELASSLGDDPDFAATMATALAARLQRANNLSDLTDTEAAFDNVKQPATTSRSGVVTLGSEVRERLTANRTYYVRTDGDDSNDGLSDTSGGAFKTIPKAINIAYGTLDLAGFECRIQVGPGTYADPVVVTSPQVGAGQIYLRGDPVTPSNVVISTTNASCISVRNTGVILYVGGFKLQTTTSGSGLNVSQSATLQISGTMEFGACVTWHILASNNAVVYRGDGNLIFSGGSNSAANASYGAIADLQGGTVTLVGAPAFGQGFARASAAGAVKWALTTFSGAATGQRYNVDSSATIFTNGGGANYFPGNAAGTNNSGAGHYA